MKSNVKGWTFCHRQSTRPYKATISINGQSHYLGSFETEAQAHKAYQDARINHPVMQHRGGRTGAYKRKKIVWEED